MTKQEQRNSITQHGGAQLGIATTAVLRELVTCNNLGRNCRDVDAEVKPFRVRMAKLQKKIAAKDSDTVARHLRILEDKGLVTVTREIGKTNWYLLHLAPMKEWGDTGETNMLRKQKRDAAKARWAAKNRKATAVSQVTQLYRDLRPEFMQFVLHPNHFAHADSRIVRVVPERI